MLIVIDTNGRFLSVLHKPTEDDYARSDVIVTNVMPNYTQDHRYIGGAWIEDALPRREGPKPKAGDKTIGAVFGPLVPQRPKEETDRQRAQDEAEAARKKAEEERAKKVDRGG